MSRRQIVPLLMGVGAGGRGAANAASASDPLSIWGSRLTGWFRGDSLTLSGSNVLTAVDKSGQGNTLGLANVSPTYSVTGGPNGTPGVTHVGGDELVLASPANAPATNGAMSMFAVAKATANHDGDIFRAEGDAAFLDFSVSGTDMGFRYCSGGSNSYSFTYGTAWHRMALVAITGDGKVYVDGVQKNDFGFPVALSTGVTQLDIGSSGSQMIWADIVFVNGLVTASEISAWDSYVSGRYGV